MIPSLPTRFMSQIQNSSLMVVPKLVNGFSSKSIMFQFQQQSRYKINTTKSFSSHSNCKNIVVFLSSVRPNRNAERVAKYVEKALANNGMNTILFDPLIMNFELVRIPIHYYPKEQDVPKWLHEANNALRDADGFLIVTAEYNSFPPPALTNMFSHFPADSYRHRPCGIISYTIGAMGGYRASTLLRPIICEFCMVSIGISVPIPFVQNIITPDGNCSSELVNTSTQKLIKEIAWYSDALKNHTKIVPPIFT